MFLRFTLIALSLLLAACSGTSRKPQDQAIYQALVYDATLRNLAEQCINVSDTTDQEVWRTQKEWWKRNGTLVEAADYGFSYNVLNLTGDRQDTGARYAMSLSFDVVSDAKMRANEALQEGKTDITCQAALAEFKDGNNDLKRESEFYSLLRDLALEKNNKGEDLLLKQAELAVQKGKKYSRSSVTAERLAKRTTCPGVIVHTLKSDWPLEIFEAACPDKTYVLVECNWGTCKIK